MTNSIEMVMDLTTEMLKQLKNEKETIDETITALERLSRQQAEERGASRTKADSTSKVHQKQRGRSKKVKTTG